MNQSQQQQDIVNLTADLEIYRQQVEDYKQKYFYAQKQIDSKSQEIESLRQMLQQTQSLRSLDPRQEDIKRTLQQLQVENQQLKLSLQNVQQMGQQPQEINYQAYPNESLQELQIKLVELQNEIQRRQNEYDILNVHHQAKIQDYNQLKTRVQAWELINNLPQGQEQNRQLVLEREFQRLNQMLDKKDRELEGFRKQLEEQNIQLQEKEILSRQLRDYEEKTIGLSREIDRLLTSVGGLRHDVLIKSQLDQTRQALTESEKQLNEWKEKYQMLENDSKNLMQLERLKRDLEDRIIQLQAANDKAELENRGLQLRQQAFDRMIKENQVLQQRIQNYDEQVGQLENNIIEKKRENEQLKRKKNELEEDFNNFKENILKPQEDRAKRLEMEVENMRNKCMALENNFFGNNDRIFVQTEFQRLNSLIISIQQENDQLKQKLRSYKPIQQASSNQYDSDEPMKQLYQEIEQIKRKNVQLEQEVSILRSQGFQVLESKSIQPQHIQIIQQDKRLQFDGLDGDKSQENMNSRIQILIDQNKSFKNELQKNQQKYQEDSNRDQKQLEIYNKEIEEWRNRFTEVIKNHDKGQSAHFDILQNEIKKYHQLHELKSIELQQILKKHQELISEKNYLENQLRQMKHVLGQQIAENDQLKRRLNIQDISQDGVDKSYYERQLRECQKLVQQLQNELQKASLVIKELQYDNDKLKQTNQIYQEQINQFSSGQNNTDKKFKSVIEDHNRVKQALEQKIKENEEIKNLHKQYQTALTNQQKENQELKSGGQTIESFKAQIQIQNHRLQDADQKFQSMQAQMIKLSNALKDKAIENEKLKKELSKIDQYQQEKNQIMAILEQLKQQLIAKQKEVDQLKQTLISNQKKQQEQDKAFSILKQNHDKMITAFNGLKK